MSIRGRDPAVTTTAVATNQTPRPFDVIDPCLRVSGLDNGRDQNGRRLFCREPAQISNTVIVNISSVQRRDDRPKVTHALTVTTADHRRTGYPQPQLNPSLMSAAGTEGF